MDQGVVGGNEEERGGQSFHYWVRRFISRATVVWLEPLTGNLKIFSILRGVQGSEVASLPGVVERNTLVIWSLPL